MLTVTNLPREIVRTLCAFALAACGAAADASWNIENLVVIQHGALSIDHGKSVKEITAAQAKGGFMANYGVGLFQNRIKTELAFGEFALAAKRLVMTTRISTAPVIYIARELPQDSCAYQLVLGHELRHQGFDLEVLRAMPDEIRFISREAFDGDAIERSGNLDQNRARSRFFQQFNYVYRALGELRHPQIDSAESYLNLSGQCNGELAKYMPRPPTFRGVAKKAN